MNFETLGPKKAESKSAKPEITNSPENQESVSNFTAKEAFSLSNLSGKAKSLGRIMLLTSTLSGLTACGSEGEQNGTESNNLNLNPTSETTKRYSREEWNNRVSNGIYSDNPRIQNRMQRIFQRKAKERAETAVYRQQAVELAAQMGIEFDTNRYNIQTEGNIITRINNTEVPWDLHSKEDKLEINAARRARNSGSESGVSQESFDDNFNFDIDDF